MPGIREKHPLENSDILDKVEEITQGEFPGLVPENANTTQKKSETNKLDTETINNQEN